MADKRFHGEQWLQKHVERRILVDLRELQEQGKAPDGSLESLRGTRFYTEIFKKYAQQFRQEREARLEARKAEQRAQEAEELPIRTARDMAWGDAHWYDTDEQLLDYVRECAAQLGQTPREKEVVGGIYIREHFGSWALVLYLAELPLRYGMKPPKPATLNRYLKNKTP